jgi:coproporphyrinogen III oxidase
VPQVWEKAGVNVSVVYGMLPPDAYRTATGSSTQNAGPVPFFAAGISSVMHPHNPMAPTMHFNYRYFETDAPQDVPGAPRAWWFGGGTDLTPSYLFDEDVKHFHGTYKGVCDKHDPAYYAKFKTWCDEYFLIKHRGERRGLGGIFFDDQNDRSAEAHLAFSTDCASAVVPAYIPLVARHKDDAFTTAQREWQQLRRGCARQMPPPCARNSPGLQAVCRVQLGVRPRHDVWVEDRRPDRVHPHVAAAHLPLRVRPPPCARQPRGGPAGRLHYAALLGVSKTKSHIMGFRSETYRLRHAQVLGRGDGGGAALIERALGSSL